MKNIFTLLFLSVALVGQAQITITTADLPTAGSSYILASDTNYTGVISPGGASQTWNYSQLVNDGQDTLSFQAAAGTPYASTFPGANLAVNSPIDSIWAYFISNANGLYLKGAYTYSTAGIGGVSNTSLVYNPAQIYAPTPFTYGSSRNEVSRFQLDITSMTPHLRIIHRTETALTGDGYGSLTTPYATYSNTIRIKSVDLSYDSIFVDLLGIGFYTFAQVSQSQTTSYKWYKNGHPSYVLGLDADSLGTNVTGADFLFVPGATGVQTIANQQAVKSYPNPANNFMTIEIPQELKTQSTLQVYNNAGQQINNIAINNVDQYLLDVKEYPSGLYSIIISGAKTYSSRFVVQH
ncbi:MAG: T9SS type A sorting domain-containing protein [Bacteroidota bacterium]